MTTPVFFRIGNKTALSILGESDLLVLMQWVNDPKVNTFLNRRTPISFATERAFLARENSGRDEVFGIYATDQEKLIGTVALHGIDMIHQNAVFGIMIGDKESWNKGYGTEATRLVMAYGFLARGLEGIELEVFEENTRAIRCYEKVGFFTIGCYKRWLRTMHGTRADVRLMQATIESFQAALPKE